MKRSKKVISLLFAMLMFGSIAIVTPVVAAEEDAPKWVEKAPMKIGRQYLGAEALDGKIYVFGGSGGSYSIYSSVEIYDPKADTWTDGSPMPKAKKSFAIAQINQEIYIIGGKTSEGTSNSVEIYDTKTDTWKNGPLMPNTRASMESVSLGGKIYIIGGETNALDIDIFDVETEKWTTGTSLPLKLYDLAAVAWRDKIYVLGGEYSKDDKNYKSNKVFIYDVKTNTWEEGPTMPGAINFHTANLVGDQIYVLGGATYDGMSRTAWILDIKNNEWLDGQSLTGLRCYHTSAAIGQTVYIIGGSSNGITNLNQMEALSVAAGTTAPDPTPQNPKLAVLLNPGEVVQLSVSDNLADNAGLNWTSSGAGVATVDTSGKVTAIAPGLCEITAKNADGTFDQSIPVRVLPGTADLFRLAVHLTPNQTKRLSMLDDQEGVTWKSLDEAIVTVDANGQITAAGAGLAIVEATKGDTTQQMYVRVKATA